MPVVVVVTEPAAREVLAEADALTARLGARRLAAPADAGSARGRKAWLRGAGLGDAVVVWHDAEGWALADAARPEARLVRAGGARGSSRHEALGRAVGAHRRDPRELSVVDATAGLGRDAFTIAAWGCRVTLIERSAVLVTLLREARGDSGRPALVHADAGALLRAWPSERRPDVVFLDPMHPPRRKLARVRHELALVGRLLGPTDADEERALLDAALDAAPRVVVKRPPHGEPLGGREPSHAITTSRVRFDVHVA